MSDSLLERRAQLSTMQSHAEELEASLEQLTALKRQVARPQGHRGHRNPGAGSALASGFPRSRHEWNRKDSSLPLPRFHPGQEGSTKQSERRHRGVDALERINRETAWGGVPLLGRESERLTSESDLKEARERATPGTAGKAGAESAPGPPEARRLDCRAERAPLGNHHHDLGLFSQGGRQMLEGSGAVGDVLAG